MTIPCIDDITEEELNRREREAMEHPELCHTLADVIEARKRKQQAAENNS